MRAGLATLLLLMVATPARAGTVVQEGDFTADLSGYMRTLTGLSIPDAAELGVPDVTRLHSAVVRTELRMAFTPDLQLDVHSRLFFQYSTPAQEAGSGAFGVGTTLPPSRTVDLSTEPVNRPGVVLQHDLDRLALRWFIGPVDVVIGRQAISWGMSNLFNVADVWAAFSPFDLDQTQKRGIDAARVTTSPVDFLELDFVVADRGSLDDLSGGVRATFFLDFADVYVATAKVWDEVVFAAGIDAAIDVFKLRAEVLLPVNIADGDIDEGEVGLPRATIGFDWFHPNWLISVEGHFNGAGAEKADDYLGHLASSEVFARGESYWLGRFYGGVIVNWRPLETISLGTSVITNLTDPSALVSLSATWTPVQDVELSVGSFTSIGARPEGTAFGSGADAVVVPRLQSEFGSYGHLVYLQGAVFY